MSWTGLGYAVAAYVQCAVADCSNEVGRVVSCHTRAGHDRQVRSFCLQGLDEFDFGFCSIKGFYDDVTTVKHLDGIACGYPQNVGNEPD